MATKGTVKGIVSNLVTVEVDGPVSQNEICYISVGGVKLMAEVIKVIGKDAYVQVFESTRGMRVGDQAEFQGHMLEVTLVYSCIVENTLIRWMRKRNGTLSLWQSPGIR